MTEVLVSVDIEADGPIPGPHSMLSFAAAAYKEDKVIVDRFEANLHTLPFAEGHPDTMAWWKTQPEAWKACRENLQDPEVAMKDFVAWSKRLPGKPVFVGYPTGFDFTFMYWYMMFFAKESPYSFSALDIKSYVSGMLKMPYREVSKRNMPKRWFDKGLPHTHKAIDDAIEQGALCVNIIRENKGLK